MVPLERRILLVTANEWRRLRGLRILGRPGYQLQLAASFREAIHWLAAANTGAYPLPDLILVDQESLGAEALLMIRTVRNAEIEVPIVVLAVFGAADDVIGCLSAGAADYISLPATPRQIQVVLSRVLALPTII